MDDIPNKTLVTVLIAAIVISLGGTLISLNKLTNIVQVPKLSGMATADTGVTTITIQNEVSIIITAPALNTIDFGTGTVNVSGGCNRANMVAKANGSSQFFNAEDCWTGSSTPAGWVVENNGNLNATFEIRGPEEHSFFNRTGGEADAGLLFLRWRVNLSDGGCLQGANETWVPFNDDTTACENLPWSDTLDDDVGIDVNISVPSTISSGAYTNSSIEFYAVEFTG